MKTFLIVLGKISIWLLFFVWIIQLLYPHDYFAAAIGGFTLWLFILYPWQKRSLSRRGVTRRVLSTLAARGELSGSQLVHEAGISTSKLYPTLMQLEHAKWIASDWEPEPVSSRPRRRMYRITELGVREGKRL